MTSNANPSTDPTSVPPTTIAAWVSLAQQCLSQALRFDYLSSGRGHAQSRRVVRERFAAGSAGGAGSGGSKRLERGTLPSAAAPAEDAERRYLSEVAGKRRLTSREEYCLVIRMKKGDRAAYEALIEANLGLVVMFARRYQRQGVPLLDLVAEGNFGLMRAAERFDPEMGCRFATYAKWWVRQSIQQALPKLVSVVRIPMSQAGGAGAARLPTAGRHAPLDLVDNGLMSSAVDEDAHSGADADAEIHGHLLTYGSVAHGSPNTSGHARGGRMETNDAELLDSIAIDPEHEPPGEAMAVQRLRVLHGALDALSERDRIVVVARYALEDDRVCTLDELATRFGVSIERIRQIENAAIKKLAKALGEAGESADSLL
jgi:RNA polymerase sigma factor (sigma-70 family)